MQMQYLMQFQLAERLPVQQVLAVALDFLAVEEPESELPQEFGQQELLEQVLVLGKVSVLQV
jgi:hypothetical protein